ncbi:MAG: LysR family transcriptional regulator [Clostridia bacterium]|nr:LysR family transcriptional regulator [Clostridia bacterium]
MVNFSLDLLKIFYEVATKQSITKASEALFISQPAVSFSIKKLEEELGGTLFNRSNKGISLTKEGESFFEYVKFALQTIKNGQDEFANFKGLQKGEIKIGISTTLTKLVLIDAIREFHKDYPGVKISIINGLTSTIIDELKEGKIDVAIFNDDTVDNQNSIIIKKCNHCFVFNKAFYDIKDNIDIKELCKYPLVVQNKKSNTRKMFDKITKQYNMQDLDCMEVVSQELVCLFAECGFGMGFAIEEYVDKLSNNNLTKINLNQELSPFNVYLMSNFSTPTFATKKFVEYVTKNN